MPLVSIKCPHCEAAVQIQVTSVARSRPCPACQQPLMLQVAERASGVKRKALLVADAPASDAPAPKQDMFEQRAFKGEAFDRMRADPELIRAKRRLIYGAATVAALVVIATVWSIFSSWNRAPGEPAARALPEEAVATPEALVTPTEGLPTSAHKQQAVAPMFSRPVDFEQIVKRRQSELGASFGGE